MECEGRMAAIKASTADCMETRTRRQLSTCRHHTSDWSFNIQRLYACGCAQQQVMRMGHRCVRNALVRTWAIAKMSTATVPNNALALFVATFTVTWAGTATTAPVAVPT